MRQDPFGNRGTRRGIGFGGLRLWVLLLFAAYAGYYWFSNRTTDALTGEKVVIDKHISPQDEKALGLQAYQEILTQEILAQEIRYRRHGHPPPCGHGYDLDQRDGKCYPNGMVPPRFQSGRYYPLEYGGGRRPVPCGHGADRDIRDGLCYPTGTVPRPYQDGRPGYHTRRNGYYEMR